MSMFNKLAFSFHKGGMRDLHPTEIMKAKSVRVEISDSRKKSTRKRLGLDASPSNVGFNRPRLIKAADVQKAAEIPNVKPSTKRLIANVTKQIEEAQNERREAKRNPRANWNKLFK